MNRLIESARKRALTEKKINTKYVSFKFSAQYYYELNRWLQKRTSYIVHHQKYHKSVTN